MSGVKSVSDITSAPCEQCGAEGSLQKRTWIGAAANSIAVTVVAATAVGLVVAGVTALHSHAESKASRLADPVIAVTTQVVKWSDHYNVARGYIGRLEAVRETAAAFERDGLVVQVNFDEGDAVAKDAVIALLDTSKLQANRRELEAQREELNAQRNLAKLTLKRQDQLQSRGWSPEQRFDEARFDVARLTASIARVDAAIEALDVDIEKSQIRAPFAGKITARNLDEGAVVGAGTTVLRIIESGSLQARIGVAPEAADELEIGSTYQLSAGNDLLSATLKAKRADLSAGSRTVTALFTLNEDTDVPLGEFVVLNLERRVESPGVWLPLAALVEGRKGLWSVMLADAVNTAPMIRRESVEVLYVKENRAYVRAAFKDGDRVVTTGTNRITPGQRVVLARLDQ